eukprot:m.92161 g.92161  ORF g.92161 m.92161 type:complete len:642 (-) comp12020_c0_seq2:166-2091(-)
MASDLPPGAGFTVGTKSKGAASGGGGRRKPRAAGSARPRRPAAASAKKAATPEADVDSPSTPEHGLSKSLESLTVSSAPRTLSAEEVRGIPGWRGSPEGGRSGQRPQRQCAWLQSPDNMQLNTALKYPTGSSFTLTSIELPHSTHSIASAQFKGWRALERVSSETFIVPFDKERVRGPQLPFTLYLIIWLLETRLPRDCLEWIMSTAQARLPKYSFGGAVGASAFSGCQSLTAVEIPRSIGSIQGNAFLRCVALREVVLPRSLVEIKQHAFAHCTSLKAINLGRNLLRIENGAFGGSGLETVEIPPFLQSLGGDVFARCSALASVTFTLPKQAKPGLVLSHSCFYECKALEHFEFPGRVMGIGWSAFARTGLRSIRIPPTVKDIESVAFAQCPHLTTVTLPPGLRRIPDSCFSRCPTLKVVILPRHLETIGPSAFRSCTRLEHVSAADFVEGSDPERVLPAGVTHIGSSAFALCESLVSMVIPDQVADLNETFAGCVSLETVVLPAQLKSMVRAFSKCEKLREIALPSGLETVEHCSFEACIILEHITIPCSVISIGQCAFSDCHSLAEVTFEVDESGNRAQCEVERGAFVPCPSLKRVRLPKAVLYAATEAPTKSLAFDRANEKDPPSFGTEVEVEQECD